MQGINTKNYDPSGLIHKEHSVYRAPSKFINDFWNCLWVFPFPLSLCALSSNPVFFTIGCINLIVAARKIMAIFLGNLIFPGTRAEFDFKKDQLALFETLSNRDDLKIIPLTLSNSSCDTRSYIVFCKNIKDCNRWCLEVPDTSQPLENQIKQIVENNLKQRFHSLIVLPPATFNNLGQTTRFQCGSGVDAGLSFLEEKIKASQILIKGTYYGAGCVSEGILQHDFKINNSFYSKHANEKKPIKYAVILRNAFTKLSDVGDKYRSIILKFAKQIAGLELNCEKATTKLDHLGISLYIEKSSDWKSLSFEEKHDLRDHGLDLFEKANHYKKAQKIGSESNENNFVENALKHS